MRGVIEQVDEGPDASEAAAVASDGEPGGPGALDESLRLQARAWARQARRLCLAILLAGLAAGAGLGLLLLNLR